MLKLTILSFLLVVATMASMCHAASPMFVFNQLFESSAFNKRAPSDSNICCLPNVFSLKGSFNQIAVLSNNTLQHYDGNFKVSADYNTGKMRQDISYTVDGVVFNYTNWDIKISSTVTVLYGLRDGQCVCRKVSDFNQWNSICIPASNGKITKGKIGNYDALKVVSSQNGSTGTMWTFREPQMTSNKCWLLSSYVVVSNASQEQVFYDMIEKVDNANFILPSQCPSINQCLSQ
ncbi:predicted protein [Naegleria gruberi]|uniref:Predicted protein n=1 Tax=Naegleria gruberi TaxID=5762 RepID=D2VCB4_NAEGR|nr:uncharacterized protein NAEGRDRAFT_66512 [Naegleria gruberi]EFC45719.1 predicted protein [Naegleria gruberi]|eukprot:XP_002678463.1 predicted protein [Naegleria gruberi strain NEG-M]